MVFPLQALWTMVSDFIVTNEIVIVKETACSEKGFCFRFENSSHVTFFYLSLS